MCEQLGLIQKQEGDDMMIHTQSFTILPIYSVYQQLFNPFNSIIHVFFFKKKTYFIQFHPKVMSCVPVRCSMLYSRDETTKISPDMLYF